MMKGFKSVIVVGTILLFHHTSWARPTTQSVTSSFLDRLISEMTLKEKIGQLLVVGVKGKSLLPETEKLISDLKIGGVILYSHNIQDPTQVRTLVSQIQDSALNLNQVPLFVAIDQEGGSVARIRSQISVIPTAMAIGATRSSQFAFLTGKATAQVLLSLGINMNLAPVLDINTNEQNTVIGVRSYGEDPDLVSELGMWYIEGLQSKGIVATAKHFPGHGDTIQDSHYVIPTLDKNLQDLERFHLVPFRRAIDNGLDAIMSAHISVPALDPTGLPATFSYALLTRMIRDKMNFKGVIITDDLEMKSIQDRYSIREAAVKAILAGNDLLMVSWTNIKKYEAYNELLEAVRTGKISEERINESVKRILTLKFKRGLFDGGRKPASIDDLYTHEPDSKNLVSKIANRAVTQVFSKPGLLPLKEGDLRKVLVVTSVSQFYKDIKYFHENSSMIYLPHRPTVEQIQSALSQIKNIHSRYPLIIYGLTHRSQASLVNQVSQWMPDKDTVVVSFGSPYMLNELKQVSAYFCSYDSQKELIYSTAQVLAGILKPQGKLPVSISPQYGVEPTKQIVQAQR